jgi:hypothetical protein
MEQYEEEQQIFKAAFIIILIILGVIMGSCGPGAKLARAKKLIEKAEAQGGVWETDTVYREIKTVVSETKFDTVVKVHEWRDTLVITKDRVTTKVLVRPVEKTVYVASKCDSVVIERKVPVTVTKTIQAGITRWEWIKIFLIGFAAGVIALGLYKLLK